MSIRGLRDTLFPQLTKQRVLSVVNPVLQAALPVAATRRRLAAQLRRYGIAHLDLGGWMPVEGYLTLHLSRVEPYGISQLPMTTYNQETDQSTGRVRLVARPLGNPAVTLSYDATSGLPLVDSSLQGINLSHFLEHFDIEAGRALLRECRRVLRRGGVIRVSCPDLLKYARAYVENDASFFAIVGAPAFCNYHDLPTTGAIVAGKAYDSGNGHRWFYDAETVIALLREVGFDACEERPLHQSSLPRIADVEPAHRLAESFYVEAAA